MPAVVAPEGFQTHQSFISDTTPKLSGTFEAALIGDFRLVYYPDEATHTITLYDFASRGDAYD
jgi:hypothetical protein